MKQHGTANATSNTALANSQEAQTTATTALNKSLANETEIAKFNLTSFTSIANNDITITGGRTVGANSLQVATNTDGSIGKIYGRLSLNGSGSGNVSFPTGLRPSEEITINGLAIRDVRASNGQTNLNFVSVTIGTNGVVTFPYSWIDSSSNSIQFLFVACLLFMKNFGDAPVTP